MPSAEAYTAAEVPEPAAYKDDNLNDDKEILGIIAPTETDKEKKEREKQETEAKLKEFGGAISVMKLLSLATFGEKVCYLIGILGALAHGAGQPALCVMFGELIDALGNPPDAGFDPADTQLTAAEMEAKMREAEAKAQDAFIENVGEVAVKFMYIGVIVFFVGTIQGGVFPWFAERMVAKMRPLYFEALLYRDVGWFDTHDAGALPAEMESDLTIYTDAFGNKMGVSLMSASCAILGFVFGLFLSWQVALLMCLVIPLMGVGGLIMASSVQDLVTETQGAYAKAALLADEVLFAVRTVVSFGGEKRETARYEAAVEIARKGGLRSRIKTGVGMGYIWFIYFSSIALAFWFGMRLVYDGNDISVGNMIASFFCVLTAGFTVGQIPQGFAALHAARSVLARFFYCLENESIIQKRQGDNRSTISKIDSLELKDIHFHYPARPETKVLNGLSLTIGKGQKVAVVGESGSGKSTVMALLERFYDPTTGTVLVNGVDLREIATSSYRRQIGYVGQEPVLFATSVKNNIMQGCADATDDDFKTATLNAQMDFIEKLPDKFNTYVGSGGSQFSGGQKQRIAIARALLKKPSVLFLDEATSALDSQSEKMIQGTLDEIGRKSELGMTIVTIAHRLSTVQNSDRIYVLKEGAVAEYGTHQELTSKEGGIYQALAAAQLLAEGLDKDKDTSERQRSNSKSVITKVSSGSKSKTNKEDLNEAEEARQKAILKDYKVPTGRLLGFSKPEWWAFGPGLTFAMVSGACFPLLGAYVLVDAMVAFLKAKTDKEAMREGVEEAAVMFVILGVMKMLACIVQFASFGLIGEATTKRARVEMLKAIFSQEIGWHDNPENTSARLVKGLQLNAYRISRLCVTFGDKADALCAVIVGVVIAFISCWEMAFIMLGTIPVFGLAQAVQIMVTMGAEQKDNEVLKAAVQTVADSLTNARTVHAAGNEKDLMTLYRSMVTDIGKDIPKNSALGGLAFGLANGVMFWVLAGGFWFMGFLINEGRTDFQDGNRAFMGILYAALGSGMAFALTGDLAKAKIAAHDLFAIIDRESLIDGMKPIGDTPNEDCKAGCIEFKDVEFSYPFRPDIKVLKGVSFVIEAGQSVGLCGPSGGGKSTVMSMIQRFYDPDKGGVLIRSGTWEAQLKSQNIRWWRKQVGFVGQEPILFDTTVLENVLYGLDENDKSNVSKDWIEKCKTMSHLKFLDSHTADGWDTQVGPKGCRLSGGQKQRVAICRALIRDPPLLLLDEATSALDSASERIVAAALEAARAGRTSIAIAHRLSTIQDCNLILVVADGTIVERGSHNELMALNGVYTKLQASSKDKK
jgi:ATP-binding cassette subfamily B (MDR/TAP) protein 1